MKGSGSGGTPRDRYGAYDVLGLIGAGGMGEVYRARDRRLGREVALKVLPERFTPDEEHRARFEREARVLASLNHANIATLYGIEEADGVHALVLELVEGETLEERLARARVRGAGLPLREALAIARQIAAALDAAHEHGVIHRDLKPSNVALTPEGTVKLLDFGIAKALEPDWTPAACDAPTLMVTEGGARGKLLGTTGYMSPEQARGESVDAGADIWAFGCVLYEMLAGRAAFVRSTATETLAQVLEGEPDWSALPARTPPLVARLVRRCLEKERRARLRSIGDAHADLAEVPVDAGVSSTPLSPWAGPRTAWLATAVVALLAVAVVAAMRTPAPSLPPAIGVVRTVIPTDEPAVLSRVAYGYIALTPDGTRLLYVGADARQIFVRPLGSLKAEPIVTVGEGSNLRGLFVSPDGQSVGFVETATTLRRVPISGGPPSTLLTLDGPSRGASWAPDDTIVFASAAADTGLQRIPADGGPVTVLTRPDRDRGEAGHTSPDVLPDGRGVLYTVVPASGNYDDARVAVLDLASGESHTLIRGARQASYSGTGHLVYQVGTSLRAVAFDPERLEVTGTSFPVAPRVFDPATGTPASFSVSAAGTLVYLEPSPESAEARTLVWVDRNGIETPLTAPAGDYHNPRISPVNDTRIAFGLEQNLWVWDLGRAPAQLTLTSAIDWMPHWMPDGERLVYGSRRDGALSNLYRQAADGTGSVERLTESPLMQQPSAITADGAAVLFSEDSASGRDLKLLRLDSGDVVPMLATPRDERNAVVSPNLGWVAYESDTAASPGRMEIFVRPFPITGDGGQWQVSSGGGTHPLWSRDGEELFYLDAEGAMVAVAVETSGSRWIPSARVALFNGPYFIREPTLSRQYDVTADGSRFLMIRNAPSAASPPRIVLVQNLADDS